MKKAPALLLLALTLTPILAAQRDDILAAFRRCRDLTPAKGVAAEGSDQAAYFQAEVLPRLSAAARLVCQGADRAVIRETLLLAGAYRGAGHDKIAATAGRMFICQSDAVVAEYKRFTGSDQIHAYNAIDNGFSVLTYEDEKAVPHFDELQLKLESLRAEETHD